MLPTNDILAELELKLTHERMRSAAMRQALMTINNIAYEESGKLVLNPSKEQAKIIKEGLMQIDNRSNYEEKE